MEHLERSRTTPPSAKIVRAFGNIATISLNDEYTPSPERRANFVRELRKLDAAIQKSASEDTAIRL
jgi:hypothetical protein